MNEILYCIVNQYGTVLARDLNMDNAIIFVRALFDHYYSEDDIEFIIKRQKEDIEQPSPSTRLYAISQTSESGETYYRDFKNCAWKKGLDECCLYSEKRFVEDLAESSWKENCKILTFDLNLKDTKGFEYWHEYDENNNEIYLKNSDGLEIWKEYNTDNKIIHYKDSTGYEYWKDYYPNGDIVTTERGRIKD